MRTHLESAYVLHHRPYRDTSRILELFTRGHGRISLFARGARGGRRSATSWASMLQPFNRLLVSWSARGDAGQLTGVEFDGPIRVMPPARLVSGFYLNELLLKLFARHDPHADVFDLYATTIEALKESANPLPHLRLFEKRLLEMLGYGLALERDCKSGAPIEADATYHYRVEQGAMRTLDVAEGTMIFAGSTLLAIAREDFEDAFICAEARRLFRAALDRVLEGEDLRTRDVMLALRRQRGGSKS
ncbi:MAG: DNA repair protein RecO [Gammaproteobacteria bacterium]|nr:DNA repair protein RecO [Gammaproteobacteria bacterium]